MLIPFTNVEWKTWWVFFFQKHREDIFFVILIFPAVRNWMYFFSSANDSPALFPLTLLPRLPQDTGNLSLFCLKILGCKRHQINCIQLDCISCVSYIFLSRRLWLRLAAKQNIAYYLKGTLRVKHSGFDIGTLLLSESLFKK